MTDLLKELEGLEQRAIDVLTEAGRDTEGVRLPFAALYIHVINGDPKLKDSKCPAQYFGGFSADADRMGEMVDLGEVDGLPGGWTAYTGVSGDKEWNALGSRSITVAVIKGRQSWLDKTGFTRFPNYTATNTRRHLQYLGALAVGGNFYAPVVITAKGFQAQRVIEAADGWKRAIRPCLKELNATTLPRSAWWISLGTSGDKPEFETVGREAQNRITPIRAILPAGKLEAEMVKALFVGAQNLRRFAEMYEQAKDWLEAWKTPVAPQPESRDEQPTETDLF